MNSTEQPSIFWHAYKVWGRSPKVDRPLQFSGIRTDYNLNVISKPEAFYCQLPVDYLPSPSWAISTGLTPQKAQRDGISEPEFAARIHALLSVSNTCVAGYNSVHFDDEVSLHLFCRNFYPDLDCELQNGNSRWDIIDMTRLCHAVAPEGINWPINDEGKVSFRLELLTAANGISHESAHDATSDVYATIALAKLIKDKQPKLYNFVFGIRTKQEALKHINVYEMAPFLHTSSKITPDQRNTSWYMPLDVHPSNKNAIISVDLAQDITPLFELTSEQIKERLYTRHDELKAEGKLPIPVKLVHINKCPAVAPAKVLTPERAALINIDREQCLKNWKALKEQAQVIKEKLAPVFTTDYGESKDDPEQALYSGSFFSHADKEKMTMIHTLHPEKLASYPFNFTDPRLDTLLFRFRARNYPHTLDIGEQQKWQQYCQNKLSSGGNGLSIDEYMIEIENFAHQYEDNKQKMLVLKALYEYVQGESN